MTSMRDRLVVLLQQPFAPLLPWVGIALGLLVAPLGPERGVQTLWRYHKSGSLVRREALGEVRFVPMVHGT